MNLFLSAHKCTHIHVQRSIANAFSLQTDLGHQENIPRTQTLELWWTTSSSDFDGDHSLLFDKISTFDATLSFICYGGALQVVRRDMKIFMQPLRSSAFGNMLIVLLEMTKFSEGLSPGITVQLPNADIQYITLETTEPG